MVTSDKAARRLNIVNMQATPHNATPRDGATGGYFQGYFPAVINKSMAFTTSPQPLARSAIRSHDGL